MAKLLSVIFIILLSVTTYSQDLDIYKHYKNSNFELPDIPAKMTYEEFKILSTDLRMQDMVIAAILPGHIHFKIDEKTTGYYILGARSLGYLGWVYLGTKEQSLTGILFKDNIGLGNNINTSDKVIAYGSVALIISSYLYDWIHGKYTLDDKQNRIRYKYAPKKMQVGLNFLQSQQKSYPAIAIIYNL